MPDDPTEDDMKVELMEVIKRYSADYRDGKTGLETYQIAGAMGEALAQFLMEVEDA